MPFFRQITVYVIRHRWRFDLYLSFPLRYVVLNRFAMFCREMRHLTNSMEFEVKLGKRVPRKQDDILVVFNEDNPTLDRVTYSAKTNNELVLASSLNTGDTLVVAKSTMFSMSGRNSKSISNCNHLTLPIRVLSMKLWACSDDLTKILSLLDRSITMAIHARSRLSKLCKAEEGGKKGGDA